MCHFDVLITYELKLRKKQPMQKGLSDTPLFPLRTGNESVIGKVPSLSREGEGVLTTRDREFRAQAVI